MKTKGYLVVNRNNLGILLRGGLKVEIRAGVNKPPKEYRHILNLEIAIQACWKDYQANESKINDIIGKDSISYSFLSIWNKIY